MAITRLAARLLRLGHSVLVLCPGDVARPPVLEHAGLLVRVPSTPKKKPLNRPLEVGSAQGEDSLGLEFHGPGAGLAPPSLETDSDDS